MELNTRNLSSNVYLAAFSQAWSSLLCLCIQSITRHNTLYSQVNATAVCDNPSLGKRLLSGTTPVIAIRPNESSGPDQLLEAWINLFLITE